MNLLSHESVLSTFFEAIREDNTDKLLTFNNMTWDLHTSYQNGRILLHYAAILGKSQAIDILVSELGIDVNIREPETGRTALHHAVLNTDHLPRLDTIYTLITLGTNVFALDNEGYRASQYVEDRERHYHFKYPEEQKVKAAKLTGSSYNISVPELGKLLQIPDKNLNYWLNQYKEEYGIKTKRQESHEKKARVIYLIYVENMTQKQVAEELGMHESSVSYYVTQYEKQHGIKIQQQDLQKKKERVIHLITTENMTQSRAAEEVGVPETTVSDWMKQYREENNIPPPRQGFQEKKARVIHLITIENRTHSQVTEEVGVPETTVDYWMRQHRGNVPSPPPQNSQEDINKAVEMFNSGMNAAEIARVLEKRPRTVRRWLQPYKAQLLQQREDKAIRMYKAGISIKEIAINLKASTHTISNWVHPYKNKYTIYPQQLRDHAAKMFIENGMSKEAIIENLNIPISIETLNIWIDHYKEKEQIEDITIAFQRTEIVLQEIEEGLHKMETTTQEIERDLQKVKTTAQKIEETLQTMETASQETEETPQETEEAPQERETTTQEIEETLQTIETSAQEINELQDDNFEEDIFDQSDEFYSEESAARAIVERNLSLKDTIEIANKNNLNLERLKLYVRNYRYR